MADKRSKLLFEFDKGKKLPRDEILGFTVRELTRYQRFNWAGIYWVVGDELVLWAWDGPAATQHVRIKIGEGVCGSAVAEGKTINVPDVNKDPRYLSCFPSTRSELVVPIHDPSDRIVGEIDIDSDELGPFTDPQVEFVERVAAWVGQRAKKVAPETLKEASR